MQRIMTVVPKLSLHGPYSDHPIHLPCRCWFGKRAGIYTDYIYQGPMILVLLVRADTLAPLLSSSQGFHCGLILMRMLILMLLRHLQPETIELPFGIFCRRVSTWADMALQGNDQFYHQHFPTENLPSEKYHWIFAGQKTKSVF